LSLFLAMTFVMCSHSEMKHTVERETLLDTDTEQFELDIWTQQSITFLLMEYWPTSRRNDTLSTPGAFQSPV